MTHEPPDADTTITEIAARLSVKFPSIPAATVKDTVAHAYEELNDAHVRDFVEVLVEKQANKRLKHLKE